MLKEFGLHVNAGRSLPLILMHTRALMAYLLGGLFTLQKFIIRYDYFQNKCKCLYFNTPYQYL